MHHVLQEKAAFSKPVFEGAVWSCPMSKLMDAYEAAWAADKTPLLVDCTLPSDAAPGDSSPLETFFSYSSEGIIELKKAVVQVSAKKEKTVAEVQDEFAQVLLRALKHYKDPNRQFWEDLPTYGTNPKSEIRNPKP